MQVPFQSADVTVAFPSARTVIPQTNQEAPRRPTVMPSPPMQLDGPSDTADDRGNAKARKACINCRQQKMKCLVEHRSSSCRRCLRSGITCIFVPRANSASFRQSSSLPLSAGQRHLDDQLLSPTSIARRLKRLEDHLGLADADSCKTLVATDAADDEQYCSGQDALGQLWQAAAVLSRECSAGLSHQLWERPTIKQLWSTFHDNMPALHFLPDKQTFSAPRPVLLAAILYCSSLLQRSDVAGLAADYFTVMCRAIAQLCVPHSEISKVPDDPAVVEEWAFQIVLGIIIAGLVREAVNKETGLWISLAYRMALAHCPPHFDEKLLRWQRLFSGLQIVDLEHASIHLSCPVIPIEAPLPRLRVTVRDQLYRLSRMMYTGLTHFTGRGLPTIWSCFFDNPVPAPSTVMTFGPVDSAVIRDWARQLDEWLVEFGAQHYDSEREKKLIFRQYILHRVLVLSIYLPVRGCNLFSNTTPAEQHELLLSARAAVKLQLADGSIWANWDLVIITWAALIVLQAVFGGVGEPDDLDIVRFHLEKLRETSDPKPDLREVLATRLEQKMNEVSPSVLCAGENGAGGTDFETEIARNLDNSWYLFDQANLQASYNLWSPYYADMQ